MRKIGLSVSALLIAFLSGCGGGSEKTPATSVPTRMVSASVSPTLDTSVHRFANPNTGGHFFTSNEAEKDYVLANLPAFKYEGVGYKVSSTQISDSLPVMRYSNKTSGFHFFSIDPNEQAILSANPLYKLDGTVFYAYTSQLNGSSPVYRFKNTVSGAYFWTNNEVERDYVVKNLSAYVFEGTSFYATPASSTASVYVVGASYSSDGPEDANVSTAVSGDARNVNGPIGTALWIENYATAIGALIPVSSTRTPASGQSATNFARGGAFAIETRTNPPTPKLTATNASLICNSGSVGCGDYNTAITKYPRSVYDQWLALAATSPNIKSSDVFAIDQALNDLVRYYRLGNTGPAGASFINDRADVMEGIVNRAIALGFKKILIANVPALNLLPSTSGLASAQRNNFANDIASLNTAIGGKVATLKASNPSVQFYKADWNAALTDAVNGVGIWAAVNATDSAEAQSPGLATSQSVALNVKWWDSANVHPSAKLHKYMADNYISLWP